MMQLKCNGRQINSVKRFYQHFNLMDALHTPDALTSFVMHHIQPLHTVGYHVAVLQGCAIPQTLDGWVFQDDYWAFALYGCPLTLDAGVKETLTVRPQDKAFTQAVYTALQGGVATAQERQQLYYFICASCFTSNCLYLPGSASLWLALYYQRPGYKSMDTQPQRPPWYQAILPQRSGIPQTIELPASKTPYCFPKYPHDTLQKQHSIVVVRIQATQPRKGNNTLCTTLQLTDGQGQVVDSVVLAPGAYCYCTTANGQALAILPHSRQNGKRMLRRNDLQRATLTYTDGQGEQTLTESDCTHTFGFDVDETDGSWLLISNYKLNATHYVNRLSYQHPFNMLREYCHLVDVQCRQGYYYTLDEQGTVHSDDIRVDGATQVCSLEEVIKL